MIDTCVILRVSYITRLPLGCNCILIVFCVLRQFSVKLIELYLYVISIEYALHVILIFCDVMATLKASLVVQFVSKPSYTFARNHIYCPI